MDELKTTGQHLEECKKKALEALAQRGKLESLTCLASELSKHPGTDHFGLPLMPYLIAAGILPDTEEAVREFIEGMNYDLNTPM